ncbi:uncharacterized protein KQ657_004363 [Scheffersomyces spartinae]|uniref:Major facilitator superfamily (MFS) profile domain-containing protein n=1 Tax=Scheffersomyces spartinae TaxID=45513 RepID=A0A9P8AJE8_9ASCO|nr:uncharacterized protein KQ657_004363 [Scheffersomyces spartinae]KAG7194686.1 hypothetical protein KQ657_004363 [Scheffersomyces spartinae]
MKGFPYRQMLVICLIRFSEPLAFTSIFPYMYFMIRDFHIAPDEHLIAKYSGYLASSFALCQFIFAVKWGKLSDIYGRKPILLFGMCGTVVSLLVFGFSTSYYMAFGARMIAGCLNGNVAVLRTMVGEIVKEKKHQPLAFLTLPLLFNFGSTLGPLIGGSSYFTRPKKDNPYGTNSTLSGTPIISGIFNAISAPGFGSLPDQIPSLYITTEGWSLYHDKFLDKYPYALSNIVVSTIILISCTIGLFQLQETHPKLQKRRDPFVDFGDSFLRCIGFSTPERPWHQKEIDDCNETAPLLGSRSESESNSECGEDEGGLSPVFTKGLDRAIVNQYGTNGHTAEETAGEETIRPLTRALSRDVEESPGNQVTTVQSIASGPTDYSNAFTPAVITVLTSNFILSFHAICYNEFLPVFLASPLQRKYLHFPLSIKGGFGLTSEFIGKLFSSTGIAGMAIILVIFPLIDRKLGTIRGFRFLCSIFPFMYFFVPLTIFTHHDYNSNFPRWVMVAALYTITSLKTLAQLTGMPQITLLNHRAAHVSHRAYINSTSMSIMALARFTGPMIFGYVMSFGDSLGRSWLIWWCLSMLSLFGFFQSFRMDEYAD